MSIIRESLNSVFDTDKIKKGDFVRAKYHSWETAKNGLVISAKQTELSVLYFPEIGNVSNYFPIRVDEVVEGLWELQWSPDLVNVLHYGGEEQ